MYEDSSRDMKCTLNPNIKNISGRMGGILFKTYRRPDGSQETRAYGLPKLDNGKFGYKRRKPLSDNEIASRARFAQVSLAYKSLSDETKERFLKEWRADKYKFNGKKYATPKGYTMARLYAELPKQELPDTQTLVLRKS